MSSAEMTSVADKGMASWNFLPDIRVMSMPSSLTALFPIRYDCRGRNAIVKPNTMLRVRWLIFLFAFLISTGLWAQTEVFKKVQDPDTLKDETPSSVPAGNTQLAAPKSFNNIIKPDAI